MPIRLWVELHPVGGVLFPLISSSSVGNAVARTFAINLALLAFSVSAAQSAVGSSDFVPAIQRALLAGLYFLGIGFILGDLARRVVEESVRLRREVAGKQ